MVGHEGTWGCGSPHVCVCVCALALLGTSRTLLMPCKLLLHLLIRTEILALQHHPFAQEHKEVTDPC